MVPKYVLLVWRLSNCLLRNTWLEAVLANITMPEVSKSNLCTSKVPKISFLILLPMINYHFLLNLKFLIKKSVPL